MARIDPAAARFIAAIPALQRPLFERLHKVILEAHPEAEVTISYQVPRYRTAHGYVFLGLWKQGVSLHAVNFEVIAAFKERHPEIKTGKGSINFKATDRFTDAEVRRVIKPALG